MPIALLDHLKFCNGLGHLFLPGSKLSLRRSKLLKLLLFGSEFFNAAPHDGEILLHDLKLLH